MATRSRRWVVFGLGASLFIISMLYRASAAVIAPDLMTDLGLSRSELGFLGAIFFYVFALAQLPMGLILDRIGPRLAMSGLNLVGLAGAVVFSQADGLAGGLAGRALLGVGMSANLMGPLLLMTRWFPVDRFGLMVGSTMALGIIGSMMASSPLVLLAQLAGWRGSFLVLAGINLGLTGLFFWLVRDAPSRPAAEPRAEEKTAPPRGSIGRAIRLLLTSRDYWLISWTTFIRYGTFGAIQTLWVGPFLIQEVGLAPLQAGQLILVLNIGAISGGPIGGWLSDRVIGSRKRTIQLGLSLMIVSLGGLIFRLGGEQPWRLGLMLFSFGLGGTFCNIMYAQMKELMPAEMAGTSMSGINLFTMVGAGVFSQGLGTLLEWRRQAGEVWPGPYEFGFAVCLIALLAALVTYSLARDSRIRPGGGSN